MVRFHVHKDAEAISPEIRYVLNTWAKNQKHEIIFSDRPDNAVTVGKGLDNMFSVVTSIAWEGRHTPGNIPFVQHENGRHDLIASAFQMINSVQEYDHKDHDELGRFKFTNSYQCRLKNANENIVQRCFDDIAQVIGLPPLREDSRFFLSHDIDLVNGAIIEDGFNVIKKGRIDLFLKMLFHVAIGKPDWLNMDKIIGMESAYDCKSIFFWIVNKGKINRRERNADYSFSSKEIQKQFQTLEQNGFENGIHKSISNETFAQEFVKYGRQPTSNRYHYLKFQLPGAYHDLEEAGLKLDTSLGFSEEIGFRNSYGSPFNPYNFISRKPFSFVEAPLHIMDRTYFQYKKYPVKEAEDEILDFFERNRKNSVLAVLWHNNFFSNYKFKGYLELYKKILVYIRENNLNTMSAKEIIKRYSIT